MGKNKLSLETNRHFTIIIDDIVYNKNLTAYEKLLYVILKTYTNKNTNTIFPSHKTLSENMNVSIFTVKKAIQGLIEKGYLKKKSGKKGVKGTKDTSNTYTLIEKIEEKKEPSYTPNPDAQESQQPKTDNKPIGKKSQEENFQDTNSEKKKVEKAKQAEPDGSKTVAAYEEIIKKNIAYADLCNSHPYDKKFIDELINNILDVVMSNSKTIRIANEQKNIELVKSVLLKLNYYQIEYILEKYKKITAKITNKRQYILTMLYNARLESESDVINEVAHDLSVLPVSDKNNIDLENDFSYPYEWFGSENGKS